MAVSWELAKLLMNWSPVGLLYKAFAAALKYLGVDLPAKFTDFGSNLIDGLGLTASK